MSSNLFISILLIAIVGIAMFWFWQRSTKEAKPTLVAKPIFTKSEEERFNRLCSALPAFYIFPKVAIGTLLGPESTKVKSKYADFERIAQKTIAFAVYDADLRLVCIVDLAGLEGSTDADTLIDDYFKSAGIKSIRWDADANPTVDQISRYFLPLASQGKSKRDAERKEATDTVLMMYRDDPEPSNVSGLTVPTLDKLTPNKVLLNLYPHVWERICVFAVEPKHLQKYLISLSLQDRSEKRAGFTLEALKEIADIGKENDRFLLGPSTHWQPGVRHP